MDASAIPSGKAPLTKDSIGSSLNSAIRIHPQAASFVCRKVFDMFITLSKSFPEDFITSPSSSSPSLVAAKDGGGLNQTLTNTSVVSSESQTVATTESNTVGSLTLPSPSLLSASAKKHRDHHHQPNNIFDVLLAHDSIHGIRNKPSKGSSKHYGMFLVRVLYLLCVLLIKFVFF